jgi:hypothetical protein
MPKKPGRAGCPKNLGGQDAHPTRKYYCCWHWDSPFADLDDPVAKSANGECKEREAAGLRVASVFRSFIVTLPPSANLVCIGQLSERDWQGVRDCAKVALAELDNSEP